MSSQKALTALTWAGAVLSVVFGVATLRDGYLGRDTTRDFSASALSSAVCVLAERNNRKNTTTSSVTIEIRNNPGSAGRKLDV